jgi:hypothetical protein
MKTISRKYCLWVVLSAALLCRVAAAQEDAAKAKEKEPVDTKATRISLASSSGTPGSSVVVPIYLTPGEGVQVGRLKITVTFVSANLKFDKLERGIAAEMGGVKVTSDLKLDKNDKGLETSTLVLEAEAPASPKKPIPAGLLAYLAMKISETGRPAKVSLRTTAEGSDLASNKPLANLRAVDAEVEVMAPGTQPVIACFFFSH